MATASESEQNKEEEKIIPSKQQTNLYDVMMYLMKEIKKIMKLNMKKKYFFLFLAQPHDGEDNIHV